MKDGLLSCLPESYPWKDRIHCFASIGSTNDHLKGLARQGALYGTAVLAAHQTNGHGRRGRSFHSPEGQGIYMSLLLRPGCSPMELMHLTCATAVAMCDAVETAAGIRPGIKWTNDLVVGRRKLGGILTELSLTPEGKVDFAIIGIGINCRQRDTDFPEEIRHIACSLDMVTERKSDPVKLAAAMLESLRQMDQCLILDKEKMLERYRADCITLGQEISLVRGEEVRHGKAVSVDAEGALVVDFPDGHRETVNSGEVSVRGMYGYV